MDECTFPKCDGCSEYEKCLKDGIVVAKKTPKKRDRSGYYKEYYQREKNADNTVRVTNTRYIKYTAVRDALGKLKKQIGEVNYNLVMNAIKEIE